MTKLSYPSFFIRRADAFTAMLKRKNKVYVTLSPAERRLMITAMISFRNKLIATDLPTEDVNTLLLRLMK